MGFKVNRKPRNPALIVCLGALGVGILIGVPFALRRAPSRPPATSRPAAQQPVIRESIPPIQQSTYDPSVQAENQRRAEQMMGEYWRRRAEEQRPAQSPPSPKKSRAKPPTTNAPAAEHPGGNVELWTVCRSCGWEVKGSYRRSCPYCDGWRFDYQWREHWVYTPPPPVERWEQRKREEEILRVLKDEETRRHAEAHRMHEANPYQYADPH